MERAVLIMQRLAPGWLQGDGLARALAPRMRPVAAEVLEGFDLPEEARSFLVRRGLPAEPVPPDVELLERPVVARAWGLSRRRLLLGRGDGDLLALEEGSAVVLATPLVSYAAAAMSRFPEFAARILLQEAEGSLVETRFVNSSPMQLVETLRCYAGHLAELPRVDDEGAIDVASVLEAELRRVDPRALASPGTWWSRVVDRVAAGIG